MKKLSTKIIALILVVLIAALFPVQVYADQPEYISEVKIGIGSDVDDASEDLEGYEIVTMDGEYADINAKAGSYGGGKGERAVLIGYKTTTVKSDAITDLSILNMGADVKYDDLGIFIQEKMDTEITPLLDNFVKSLEEYRINYNSDNKENRDRARASHDLLNTLFDDDTEMSLGDLFLNETRYEIGEEEYNKLSDDEKKQHADLVTVLLQSTNIAVQTMEYALAMASDTSEDNWLDRFPKLTYKNMIYQTGLPPKDAKKALSREYYDDTQLILALWDDFQKRLEKADVYRKVLDAIADGVDYERAFATIEGTDLDSSSEEELKKYAEANTVIGKYADIASDMEAIVTIKEYLEEIPYGKETMLDFFLQPYEDIAKTSTAIYPLIASLSEGQRAALNFMSLETLIMMTMQNKKAYNEAKITEQEPLSIYFGVDREMYDIGGIALTPNTTSESVTDMLNVDSNAALVWQNFKVGTDAVVANAFMEAFKYMKDDFVMPKVNVIMPIYKVYAIYSNIAENGKLLFVTDTIAPERTKYLMDCFDKFSTGFWETQEVFTMDGAKTIWHTSEHEMEMIKEDIAKWMDINGGNVFGYIAYGITFVVSAAGLYTLSTQYDIEYTPGPAVVYDTISFNRYNENGERISVDSKPIRYKACTCEREDEDYKDALGDKSDLNGDVGKQWLILYATKDQALDPILADSFKVQYGNNNLPAGYKTGLHLFGTTGAVDLNNKDFCWDHGKDGIWVFFKRDTGASVTGSVFSNGTVALIGVGGAIFGAAITAVAMTVSRKRKAEEK